MKRITCILLTCILCFSISGCTKTYKGTDELIEKAREEIQVCRNIFLTFPILQAFQPIH